jgi:protein phosphatase
MTILYPPCALVILCSPSRELQARFALQHFLPTEIAASSNCRARILDSPAGQEASDDAYALLYLQIELRLKHRRFTVIDASSLKPTARRGFLAIAEKMRVPCYLLMIDATLEESMLLDITGRNLGERVLRRHRAQFEQMVQEQTKNVHFISCEERENVTISRQPGPEAASCFDIIGDIHGCSDELNTLLARLGYMPDASGLLQHPQGRILVSVGDLADRGPDAVGVLQLFIALVAAGRALFVPGNHDDKLFSHLRGERVSFTHGFETTLAQIDALPEGEQTLLKEDILFGDGTLAPCA